MSLLFRTQRSTSLSSLGAPARTSSGGVVSATPPNSLRSGAVWACLRLRADLISTLPLDVFRDVAGRAVPVPKPPVFSTPSGDFQWHEWLYASQFDLDRYGNVFGQIVATDGAGRPAMIELSDVGEWKVRRGKDGSWEYLRDNKVIPRAQVWHERQFPVSGLPIGLSPVAYAQWTTSHYLSAQQFALDWFAGGFPTGTLKNKAQTIDAGEAQVMKDRFRVATQDRDVFVHGNDWEYEPAAGAASDAKFLDAMQSSTLDICRYYGVPGDMIDAETASGSITYANVTQRNLQLLTMNLGPAITRRELTFSAKLVAQPRYVKLNTDAMLRMDARGKLELIALGVTQMLYTHDEGRALLELEPLTDEQIAKEAQIKGPQPAPGTKTGVPA
jgi:HK97 family phage portal protein